VWYKSFRVDKKGEEMNKYDFMVWLPVIILSLIYIGYKIYEKNFGILIMYIVLGLSFFIFTKWMDFWMSKSNKFKEKS